MMETVQMPDTKRFALRAYALISCMSCVSMIPSVFQPNVSVTAAVGGSVALECYTTADPVVVWIWLKQIPGQKLNSFVSTYYQEITFNKEKLNESRLNVKVYANKSALIFSKITPRDAAYYHCGVLLYEKVYFGGGCYLNVNDAKPAEVIQQPVLDSHHEGESVTLQCSIIGDTCSGAQSVYWLRYEPRGSHSGLIYTDGDRKYQCETISEHGSTEQRCVYKVPKAQVRDETYFCSAVTCGKLIIGNGTKLIADVDPQKATASIIALLSAGLIISLIANIIMMLSWRRATHRGDDQMSFAGRTATVDNYASLKFSPKQPTQKKKSHDEPASVVYASVRQTRSVK